MRSRPLLVLLVIVGIVTATLGVEAIYLWFHGDEPGSLALATAVATFALAFAAILTIDQNRALVRAAADEARASADEARASRETLEEMQRQRELAYRPWLVVRRRYVRSDYMGYWAFVVENVGSGAAVDVQLCAVRKDPNDKVNVWSWASADTQGIAPGGEWESAANFGGRADEPRSDRYRCLTDDLATSLNEGEIVAVRYQDLFGTYYRSSPDAREILRPEEWRGTATATDAPNWLRC